MKRAGIVFALIFLVTFAIFSGCVSQKEEENGTDVNTTPVEPGKTVSYLKAKINISKPYDLSDLNSSRQNVVIIRDSGMRLDAIVTLYGETYTFDDTTRIPILETEEDVMKTIDSLPEDVRAYIQAVELDEGIYGTGTVHWTEPMHNLALSYAKDDADYNLYGTATLIMEGQKGIIRVDESPYLSSGYEYWWMQGATETLDSKKALGVGPYTSLYTSLMRSMMVPTKVVYGLYYDLEEGGVWKPYAWNEIYFNGKWVPVDPYRQQIGTLSRYYLELDEVVDLMELYDDFACYRSNFEGKGCKPFTIEILEQGTVLESEIKK